MSIPCTAIPRGSDDRREPGDSVAKLAAVGALDAGATRIFRLDGKPLRLHRHRSKAVVEAR